MCNKLDIGLNTPLEETIGNYLEKTKETYANAVITVLDEALEPLGYKRNTDANSGFGFKTEYQKDGGASHLFIYYYGDCSIHGTLYVPDCKDGRNIGYDDGNYIKTIGQFVEELKK
jgi:hypothetical protein